MLFDLRKDNDLEKAKEKLNKAYKDGKTVDITVKNKKRTLKQNAYLHLILGWYGLEFGYTLDESKDLFKALNLSIFEYEKKGNKFIKSTAVLDTKEMTKAIDNFRMYSDKNGCYLPSPNEKQMLEYIGVKVSQAEEWL